MENTTRLLAYNKLPPLLYCQKIEFYTNNIKAPSFKKNIISFSKNCNVVLVGSKTLSGLGI